MVRGGSDGIEPVCGVARRLLDDSSLMEEANAHLIAAAPTLLRELQHLVALLEPLEADGRLDVPGLPTLNGGRLAIRQATGAGQ